MPCNGHSDQCDAESGTKCINCQNDTRNGDQNRCEICKPGFMGSGQAGNNCWCTCAARRAMACSAGRDANAAVKIAGLATRAHSHSGGRSALGTQGHHFRGPVQLHADSEPAGQHSAPHLQPPQRRPGVARVVEPPAPQHHAQRPVPRRVHAQRGRRAAGWHWVQNHRRIPLRSRDAGADTCVTVFKPAPVSCVDAGTCTLPCTATAATGRTRCTSTTHRRTPPARSFCGSSLRRCC